MANDKTNRLRETEKDNTNKQIKQTDRKTDRHNEVEIRRNNSNDNKNVHSKIKYLAGKKEEKEKLPKSTHYQTNNIRHDLSGSILKGRRDEEEKKKIHRCLMAVGKRP